MSSRTLVLFVLAEYIILYYYGTVRIRCATSCAAVLGGGAVLAALQGRDRTTTTGSQASSVTTGTRRTEHNILQGRGWYPGGGQYCTWWPARAIPLHPGYTPASPRGPHRCTGPAQHRVVGVERCPGLKAALSVRVGQGRSSEAAPLFLYLRPFSPGSQSQLLVVQGKCWIDPGTLDPRDPGAPGPG